MGDLIISNLTMEDMGTYTAFDDGTNRELASYTLQIANGNSKLCFITVCLFVSVVWFVVYVVYDFI